ncbi:hypothetical protein AGMMS49960_12320 [Betaproteobacteria bacterium]|nr:hypothetical protein AGMMS49960_12320 [Betaproteobacteria bacterium]
MSETMKTFEHMRVSAHSQKTEAPLPVRFFRRIDRAIKQAAEHNCAARFYEPLMTTRYWMFLYTPRGFGF